MKLILIYLLSILSLSALPAIETVSIEQLQNYHANWLSASPNHRVIQSNSSTGSMKPYLVGGETLFLERYIGQPLESGMLIIFARWDYTAVLHQLVELSQYNHFKAKCLNCMYADGWYPVKRIRWIARRVIRTR